MASIFTRIINGEIPCYKVAENEDFFAFLDIRPRTKGHTLVVPKKEIDYLFDLDEETYIGLHLFAKKIAKAIVMAVPCQRVATTVIGLEVPHCHIHLLPIHSISDTNFTRPHFEMTNEEFAETAKAIAEKVAW
ncbi:MAG: HIT family protein [Bacteroidia bacterium]